MSTKVLDAIRKREQAKIRPEPVKPPKKRAKPVVEEPEPASAAPIESAESDG